MFYTLVAEARSVITSLIALLPRLKASGLLLALPVLSTLPASTTCQRKPSGGILMIDIVIAIASLSSEPKCNTPADLIIGTVDQDLRECCHAMLFAFVG